VHLLGHLLLGQLMVANRLELLLLGVLSLFRLALLLLSRVVLLCRLGDNGADALCPLPLPLLLELLAVHQGRDRSSNFSTYRSLCDAQNKSVETFFTVAAKERGSPKPGEGRG
jgi:hypothetical protein